MFLESSARPVHRADNLTTTCEPIIYTMWELQHQTTFQASTAVWVITITITIIIIIIIIIITIITDKLYKSQNSNK
jgi:hypothetical protein